MAIARRLYLYLVTGVALALWAIGTVRMVRVGLFALSDLFGTVALSGDAEMLRCTLSVSLALLLVGFPVWALHWWLIGRGIVHDRDEQRSAIRALYLVLVLWITFGLWLSSGHELLRLLFLAILGTREPGISMAGQAFEELALFLPVTLIWWYHWGTFRADHQRAERKGVADWLPRLYIYSATGVGLTVLVVAVAGLVRVGLDGLFPARAITGTLRLPLSTWIALLLIGLLAWGVHWGRALWSVSRREASAERESRSLVRWTYLGLVVFAALVSTLAAVVLVLNSLLGWMLSVPDGRGSEWVRQLLYPLTWAIPSFFVWGYHRRQLAREAALLAAQPVRGPDWAKGVTRFLQYLHAFAGLLFATAGVGGVVGLLLSALVAVLTGSTLGLWRSDFAFRVAVSLVGAGLWLVSWYGVLEQTRQHPVEERASLSRRVYLYVVLGMSVLTVLGMAGVVAFEFFSWLMGLQSFVQGMSDAAHPLGFTFVVSLVLAYHLAILRKDARSSAAQPALVTVRLILRVPAESDTEAIVNELSTHLPPGAVLERPT